MSFDAKTARQASSITAILVENERQQGRRISGRIAEALGVKTELLRDHVTYGIVLPNKAQFQVYNTGVSCSLTQDVTIKLYPTEIEPGETARGEKSVTLSEVVDNKRRQLTVTASGRVNFDSDAEGVPLG